MNVKNTSWHYRLWKLGRESRSEPHNLCKYFWHLALIKVLIPLLLASMVLIGVAALVWVIWNNPVTTLWFVLITAMVIGFAILAYLAWPKISRRIGRKIEVRAVRKASEPPKEPSVVRQFLKAKKQKVCPLITVVDGEK